MLSSAVSGREFDRFALRGNGELLESLFFCERTERFARDRGVRNAVEALL